jgi:hypothetical protein
MVDRPTKVLSTEKYDIKLMCGFISNPQGLLKLVVELATQLR